MKTGALANSATRSGAGNAVGLHDGRTGLRRDTSARSFPAFISSAILRRDRVAVLGVDECESASRAGAAASRGTSSESSTMKTPGISEEQLETW